MKLRVKTGCMLYAMGNSGIYGTILNNLEHLEQHFGVFKVFKNGLNYKYLNTRTLL